MKTEEIITIHDRMADVLCFTRGIRTAVLAMNCGNKKQSEALLELCKYVEANLLEGKKILQSNIPK